MTSNPSHVMELLYWFKSHFTDNFCPKSNSTRNLHGFKLVSGLQLTPAFCTSNGQWVCMPSTIICCDHYYTICFRSKESSLESVWCNRKRVSESPPDTNWLFSDNAPRLNATVILAKVHSSKQKRFARANSPQHRTHNRCDQMVCYCQLWKSNIQRGLCARYVGFISSLRVDLTHWDLVTPYGDKGLSQHWIR